MKEIRDLIRLAAVRLEMTSFIGALHLVAIVVASLAFVLALADRAPADAFVRWAWVAPGLAALALVASLVVWSRSRTSEVQVAVAVDERLDLRERLSTALHCGERKDVFARAAIADAVSTASDPRAREAVRRKFKVQAPSTWWISPLIAVAAVGVLFLPQANLFAEPDEAAQAEIDKATKEAQDTVQVVAKVIEDKPELAAELEGLADKLAKNAGTSDELAKPEDIKRDALKKVTELNKKLDDIINGEKGKTAKAVEEMMAKLRTPNDGAGKELAEALAKGDFSKAKQALEKMLQDAKNGNMDAKQQEQLAQQMADMARQLEDLAQQQKALERALKQAGLNPQLAQDPKALQQALQQAQNLNPQQAQQLQQMMQAQQAAQQMCQGLGQACQQMAQALNQGQLGQAGAQQMANQLNQMEAMQQLLQQAQAAANQCAGQCNGLGQGMSLSQALGQWKQGGGMGKWGQGSGGAAPKSTAPYGTVLTKEAVPVGEGDIIASTLVKGTPIKGESKAKLRDIIASENVGYDEAQNEDPLPRRYHEAQKHYFGELQKQVEAMKSEDVAPASSTKSAGESGGETSSESGGTSEGGDG